MTKLTWGSHTPLNRALIKTYELDSAIEMGAGVHSTKMLFEQCTYVQSFETDKLWTEYVKSEIGTSVNHEIIYMNLEKFLAQHKQPRSVNASEFSEEYFETAGSYLKKVLDANREKLLFIDTIRSLRHYFLINFYVYFNYVTFHDYNKPGITNHWNGGVAPDLNYVMLVDQTYKTFTGCWLHKSKLNKLDELKANHAKEIFLYSGKQFEPKLV